MRPTTVSVALKRLNGRGHARPGPQPRGRRSYLVGLNTAGEAAHCAAAPVPGRHGALRRRDGHLRTRGPHRVQRIDAALRSALDLDDRPYSLADDDRAVPGGSLTYAGTRWTRPRRSASSSYIDFIRSQPG